MSNTNAIGEIGFDFLPSGEFFRKFAERELDKIDDTSDLDEVREDVQSGLWSALQINFRDNEQNALTEDGHFTDAVQPMMQGFVGLGDSEEFHGAIDQLCTELITWLEDRGGRVEFKADVPLRISAITFDPKGDIIVVRSDDFEEPKIPFYGPQAPLTQA